MQIYSGTSFKLLRFPKTSFLIAGSDIQFQFLIVLVRSTACSWSLFGIYWAILAYYPRHFSFFVQLFHLLFTFTFCIMSIVTYCFSFAVLSITLYALCNISHSWNYISPGNLLFQVRCLFFDVSILNSPFKGLYNFVKTVWFDFRDLPILTS